MEIVRLFIDEIAGLIDEKRALSKQIRRADKNASGALQSGGWVGCEVRGGEKDIKLFSNNSIKIKLFRYWKIELSHLNKGKYDMKKVFIAITLFTLFALGLSAAACAASANIDEYPSLIAESELVLQKNLATEKENVDQQSCVGLPNRLMSECEALSAFDKAEKQMSDLYGQLYSRLQTEESRLHLKSSQEFWVLYRRSACAYETSAWQSGTGRSAQVLLCEERKTKQRVTEIQDWLNCKDNGCPL